MIDVPVRVKDALRSGDYRKNYKITLMKQDYVEVKQLTAIRSKNFLGEFAIYDSSLWSDFSVGDKVKIVFPYATTSPSSSIKVNLLSTGGGGTEEYSGQNVGNEVHYEFTLSANIKSGFFLMYLEDFYYLSSEITTAQVKFYKYIESEGTIDNSNLVAESVKFDERMCSDTELKFGLCEGTSVEFQYFDFPSLFGKHITIDLDVEYKTSSGDLDWYTIPMGWFDVEEISRQASTGIFKATAYNKLMSKYFDQKINNQLISLLSSASGNVLPMSDILFNLMSEYSIQKESSTEAVVFLLMSMSFYALGVAESSEEGNRMYNGYRLTATGYEISIMENATSPYFDPSSLYRFAINLSKTIINDTEFELLQRSDLYNIWDDDTQQEVSLSNFMGGNYRYSDYFGGVFIIQTSTDTYKFRLYKGDYANHDVGYIDNVQSFKIIIPAKITSMRMADYYYNHDRLYHDIDAYINMYEAAHLWDHPEVENETENIITNVYSRFATNGILGAYKKVSATPADSINIHLSDIESISDDITLRELQSAVYELNCQYGKLDRVTDLFAGIELNEDALYPRDNLYPANDLLPMGTSEAGYPAMYSKLWADEGNVRTFRYLIITYKSTEVVEGQTQEVEKKLQRTVNANGTDDYNMSDNWLFRNLVWTDAQIGTYADAMVTKMQNISWFPFEMWCAGLPYLEAGDAIEIAMQQGTYKSYVLRRNLNGIQNLQDEMINGTLDIF